VGRQEGSQKKTSPDKRPRFFKAIHAEQMRFDPSIGESIYCPVCWEKFAPASVESCLSIEHVPPASVGRLTGERGFDTLTCTQCNNTYGHKYQDDLKHFLIHQLWQSGEYDGKIPGKVSIHDGSALRCNTIWNRKGIRITVVPNANNPTAIERCASNLRRLAEAGTSNWKVHLEGNLGYRRSNVHRAYIHAAYLMVNRMTGCMYSFSNAGTEIRKLLANEGTQVEGCNLPIRTKGIASARWIARVEEPSNLRCLWVKVAGNVVILPQPDNSDLVTLYEAWQQVSEATDFGLLPRENVHLKLVFYTKEQIAEAKKCLPSSFGQS
jgi:hypothetical protein